MWNVIHMCVGHLKYLFMGELPHFVAEPPERRALSQRWACTPQAQRWSDWTEGGAWWRPPRQTSQAPHHPRAWRGGMAATSGQGAAARPWSGPPLRPQAQGGFVGVEGRRGGACARARAVARRPSRAPPPVKGKSPVVMATRKTHVGRQRRGRVEAERRAFSSAQRQEWPGASPVPRGLPFATAKEDVGADPCRCKSRAHPERLCMVVLNFCETGKDFSQTTERSYIQAWKLTVHTQHCTNVQTQVDRGQGLPGAGSLTAVGGRARPRAGVGCPPSPSVCERPAAEGPHERPLRAAVSPRAPVSARQLALWRCAEPQLRLAYIHAKMIYTSDLSPRQDRMPDARRCF